MINALQNSIGQGVKLDKVNLTTNGDYDSIMEVNKKSRPFLLDLPVNGGNMKVRFEDGTEDIYTFREGTSPVVKIIKIYDTGSDVKEFQVIY